jgi:hypothetical protein
VTVLHRGRGVVDDSLPESGQGARPWWVHDAIPSINLAGDPVRCYASVQGVLASGQQELAFDQ